ncbi:MAG: hypothetical protein RMI63_04015 [Caldimicrobium sp.]|nr:hypothetical protein [Dictyoglomus thermophilum]MCS7200426.1 hypothetical protein [Caldimicrobium sp.]MCX7719995.1 hypothetical protein [Dictyoglomus thermophilum]MDW8094178.1 hypothetical protein [Caldimicrobium sp.]
MIEERKVILVDGISSIGIHNNIVRISFFRLNSQGQPEQVLELNIPVNQIKEIVAALMKISK